MFSACASSFIPSIAKAFFCGENNMASLRKEEIETHAAVAVANLEKEAALARAAAQRLLAQIKII